MPFRFKQFYIDDTRCAMKVGTDGVLLGAWAQMRHGGRPFSVLDIGTGSGLIALMVAQRYPDAVVTGIDIDTDAVLQSRQNFALSEWSNRLTAKQISLQELAQQGDKFDCIVSNPPYFQNSLKNPDRQRSTARHTDTLTYQELIDCAKQLLHTNGTFHLILPATEELPVVQLAKEQQLYPQRICRVRGRENKPCKRVMLCLAGDRCSTPHEEDLTLECGINQRTADYRQLTGDFYL